MSVLRPLVGFGMRLPPTEWASCVRSTCACALFAHLWISSVACINYWRLASTFEIGWTSISSWNSIFWEKHQGTLCCNFFLRSALPNQLHAWSGCEIDDDISARLLPITSTTLTSILRWFNQWIIHSRTTRCENEIELPLLTRLWAKKKWALLKHAKKEIKAPPKEGSKCHSKT